MWGKNPVGHRNQEDKYSLSEVVSYANSSYTGDIDD